MDIECKIDTNKAYIYFIGELDEFSSQSTRVKIDKIIDKLSQGKIVLFDFSMTTFMDSTGIGVLLGRYKKLKKLGVRAYIANPSFQIDKILQISGIYDVMPKYIRG